MFKLKIETDNAAFGETIDETIDELGRILRETAGRMERGFVGFVGGPLRDINGNPVGEYSLEDE
jgi:hypothetical protein